MTYTATLEDVLAQPGNVELGGPGFNLLDPSRYSIPAVGNHADALKSHPNLVGFWRLGRTDVWAHNGIIDAVNANDSRTGPRYYGQAQSTILPGRGAPLAPLDLLAASTTFNGTSEYLVAPAITVAGAWSIVAIIRTGAVPSVGAGILSCDYPGPNGRVQYALGLDPPGGGGTKLTVGCYDGFQWTFAQDAANIAASTTMMVGGTFDPTGNGTFVLYRNGLAIATNVLAGPGTALGPGNVYIGKRHDAASSNPFFSGSIQDVALLNASLGASDMLALAVLAGFA